MFDQGGGEEGSIEFRDGFKEGKGSFGTRMVLICDRTFLGLESEEPLEERDRLIVPCGPEVAGRRMESRGEVFVMRRDVEGICLEAGGTWWVRSFTVAEFSKFLA